MKPFLLLTTRPEADVLAEERVSFLAATGLAERDLVHVRLDLAPLEPFEPDAWSGVIVGGSPFTSTDPESGKSVVQKRVERELADLVAVLAASDTPFFGACYGIATLGGAVGARIDRRFAEPIGAAAVRLTDAGRDDPVFGALPEGFAAFVGHKEAVAELPSTAVLLATSDTCPVQAFRVGRSLYATQFHPELTPEGLIGRVRAYRDAGYMDPALTDAVIAHAAESDVSPAHGVLAAFVAAFARD